MKTWMAVGIGGALGSMARHGISVTVHRLVGSPVPYATAIVNVVGCFVIGVLAGCVSAGTIRFSETARVLVFVGVIGGFTTFSSFGLDTLTLVRNGETGMAAANIAIQFGLGLGGVFVGYWLAK